jgi:hypothetical protein
VVQRGQIKNIAVSMEDRQGGRKHITRLVHVESFALNPGGDGCLSPHTSFLFPVGTVHITQSYCRC